MSNNQDDGILSFNSSRVSSSKFHKQQLEALGRKSLLDELNDLNHIHAIIAYGGSVFIARIHEDKIYLMTKADFLLMYTNKIYYDENGKPSKIATQWLNWKDHNQFSDIRFDPSNSSPHDVYNLWRGFAYKPHADIGKFDLFLAHVHDNICGGKNNYYEWLLDWLADLFQRPWRKTWTCVVLQSNEEGTGKGFFARQIGKLVGRHFMSLEKPGQLIGKFNAHLEDKLLLFVDEGSLTDEGAADFMKALITEPTLNIEGKGKPIREIKSYHRMIIASNHDRIINAGIHDRRYMVLQVAPHAVNNLDYFSSIEAQLKADDDAGYEALMNFFMTREYNEQDIKTTPKTDALANQKMQSMDDEVQWWMDCLTLGRIGEYEFSTRYLPTRDLYESYIKWCDTHRISKRRSESWLPRDLNRKTGALLKSITVSGMTGKRYDMPSLDCCREQFCLKFGHEINWEE